MGTALTGNTISSSYLGLIKTTDSAAISSSAKRLTDGAGNDSPLYLSTTRLGIGITPTDTLHVSGDFNLTGAFKDSSGDTGSAGQILSSTGSGTNWIANDVGDITSVVAGDGLTGGGTSGDVTLNVGAGNLIDVQADQIDVDLSELTTSTSDGDGDFFAVVDSANAQKKLTKGNINLSGFNNDLSIPTVSGTTNKIAKFTASTTVGDSVITEVSSEIGINIASPQEMLHQHIGSSSTNYHQFTNSTTGSAVNNGLLVGINSAGEAQILNKLNSANAKIRLATYAGTTIMDLNGNIEADNGSNGDQYLRISNDDSGTAAEATIYVTNSTTQADGLFLGVAGTSFTTASGFVQDGAHIGSGTGASGGLSIMTRAAADMRFYTNGHTNERMRIESGGNIAVGTTSANPFSWGNKHLTVEAPGTNQYAALDLVGSGNGSGAIIFGGGSGSGTATNIARALITALDGSHLAFYTNASNSGASFTERMRITSGGDVGISNTSPEKNLTIGSSQAEGIQFTFDTTNNYRNQILNYWNSTADSRMDFNIARSSGATPATIMSVGYNSSVGIGTTTPHNDVSGLSIATAGSTDQLYLERTGSGTGRYYLGTASNSFYIVDDVAASTRFEIDSSGFVDIGGGGAANCRLTTRGSTNDSSAFALEAASLSGATLFIVRNDGGIGAGSTGVYNTTTDVQMSGKGLSIKNDTAGNSDNWSVIKNTGTGSTANLEFVSGLGTAMTIAHTKDVLFGKTTVTTTGAGSYFETIGIGYGRLNFTSTVTTGYPLVFYYDSGGGSPAAVGSVSNSSTATSFNTSSDYRLKEDLKDFTGLDKISKIKMYDFKWKSDNSRSYGVLAHELQEIIPQAVTGEKDGMTTQKETNKEGKEVDKEVINPQNVDYSKIVPILVQSIQELKAEIDELKKK